MRTIKLMDCTLRDGGYINNWEFGYDAIRGICNKIAEAGIEFIEVGFMRNCIYQKERSVFPDNESFSSVITPKKENTSYIGMIDMSDPIPLEKLSYRKENSVDYLRVIFKKHKIEEGYEYCRQVQKLGYGLFVQPVDADGYSDKEFIELIYRFNELIPFAFYIVDTLGDIKKKDFLRLVKLADHNLKEEIALGYHSHNNFQQAFGNAEAMTELNMQRDLIIDGCVWGMGRGAGNLHLELFAEYMNEYFGKNYKITPMLEIVDKYLNEIYAKNFWGYSLPFYLSATNHCHPNYASYFAGRGTLDISTFNEVLSSIPEDDKPIFSTEMAQKIYTNYLCRNPLDDSKTIDYLSKEISEKEIFIISTNILTEQQASLIRNTNNKIIFCIEKNTNFNFKIDYRFISSARDFDSDYSTRRIVTSNIFSTHESDLIVDFSSCMPNDFEIIDNELLLCIKLLLRCNCSKITVIGKKDYNYTATDCVNNGLKYHQLPKDVANIRSDLLNIQLDNIENIFFI